MQQHGSQSNKQSSLDIPLETKNNSMMTLKNESLDNKSESFRETLNQTSFIDQQQE